MITVPSEVAQSSNEQATSHKWKTHLKGPGATSLHRKRKCPSLSGSASSLDGTVYHQKTHTTHNPLPQFPCHRDEPFLIGVCWLSLRAPVSNPLYSLIPQVFPETFGYQQSHWQSPLSSKFSESLAEPLAGTPVQTLHDERLLL